MYLFVRVLIRIGFYILQISISSYDIERDIIILFDIHSKELGSTSIHFVASKAEEDISRKLYISFKFMRKYKIETHILKVKCGRLWPISKPRSRFRVDFHIKRIPREEISVSITFIPETYL